MATGEIKIYLRHTSDKRFGLYEEGETTALATFDTSDQAREWVENYAKELGASQVKETFQTDYFQGKNVVVTGAFPNKVRADVENELRNLGANVQKAVSGTTNYLICGDRVGARKTQAAENMKVPMLNRKDYEALRDSTREAPVVVKPKLTHEEYLASIPESYGEW